MSQDMPVLVINIVGNALKSSYSSETDNQVIMIPKYYYDIEVRRVFHIIAGWGRIGSWKDFYKKYLNNYTKNSADLTSMYGVPHSTPLWSILTFI